mgnify:CR=1 FL=1
MKRLHIIKISIFIIKIMRGLIQLYQWSGSRTLSVKPCKVKRGLCCSATISQHRSRMSFDRLCPVWEEWCGMACQMPQICGSQLMPDMFSF